MGNYRLGMEMNEGYGTYLAHFGIKGQKWGIRRFQNPDGTLTPEGKRRYYKNANSNYDLFMDVKNRYNNIDGERMIDDANKKWHIKLEDEKQLYNGWKDIGNYLKTEQTKHKIQNSSGSPRKVEKYSKQYDKSLEKQKAMFAEYAIDFLESKYPLDENMSPKEFENAMDEKERVMQWIASRYL